MSTYADQTEENKSESVASAVSQLQTSGEPTFEFMDSRPEAVAQRKLQHIADRSSQVSQLKSFQELADNSFQAKEVAQLQSRADAFSGQQHPTVQRQENNTGLPDNLKTGMENLTGHSMNDVKVHRNSDKPAQLNAHAYAQGTDIHLAPGQEKHLPHELGHVVQQKEGRVKPTKQLKGKTNINDDAGLEKEADILGQKAQTKSLLDKNNNVQLKSSNSDIINLAQLAIVKSPGIFSTHGVYARDMSKKGIIKKGSKIEVDTSDNWLNGEKNYVKIIDGSDQIEFVGGGNLGGEDAYFISDRAYESEQDEGEEEDGGAVFKAGPLSYEDGEVTIPIWGGKEIKVGSSGVSHEGDMPSKEITANLPKVDVSVDIPFAPGAYATAGLSITPSMSFTISGGTYKIVAGETKSISINEASISGAMGLNITASAGAGVGVANLAGIEAGIFAALGGEATLSGTLGGTANFSEKSYEMVLGLDAAADIVGKSGVFVGAKLGFLSARKEFSLAEKTFAHYNYHRSITLGSGQESWYPVITDFTKKEFGDRTTSKTLKTKDGKTYEQLE
tara:strand:+ start:337 stop:2016 length:1680 start_codon:yes stop_codon:yes gene_type:complete